ncbi:MAG: YfhO family protein [Puniceicoccaceae bacterium]
MVKPRSLADLVALLVLLGGVGWNLFWTPAPNRVVLEVGDPEADLSLRVYYQYDRPGLRDYFVFRSGTEFVHRGDGVRRVVFDLPGGRGLRELRIDAGPPGTGFTLRGIGFGHAFAYRTVPLDRIGPGDLAGRLTAGDGAVASPGADGLRLRAGPENAAGWFLPVDEPAVWPVPADALRQLRWHRMAVAAVAAGLIFLAGRWITGGGGARPARGVAPAGASGPSGERADPGNRSGAGTREFLLFALWSAVLGFLVYEPFLLFEKWFLFRDVASDSVDAFWPVFAHLGELWRGSGVPFWSFSYGLGAPVFGWVGDPFLFALWLLPTDLLPFGLGWIQFFKVFGAGCFFFLWLRTAGLLPAAAAFAATGLAFSGHMMIRGAWFHYATEVFLVAFALWAVESRISRGRTIPFVCAVALFCVRGPYGLALWSALFLAYFLLRLWMRRECGVRRVFGMAPLFLLGVGLGAVFLLPNAATIFLSPRVSGAESQAAGLLSRPLLDVNPPGEWLSSLAGLFAPDLLGKGDFYSGWRNYLEGPHLYGGLLVALLLPQAFIGRGRRTRRALALALCAVGLYLLIPQARFFLNAYAASYYKMSSFWVTLVLTGAAGLALDGILRRGILGTKTLLATLAVCLGALLWLRFGEWPGRYVRIAESRLVFQQVLVLLPLYAAVLWMIARGIRGSGPSAAVPAESPTSAKSLDPDAAAGGRLQRAGVLLLFGLLAWEVVNFGGGVHRDRLALRSDTMATGGLYADDAAEAAAMIAAADSGFHRVARETMSVQLNDALLQGYYGLRSYNSFHPGSVIRFLGRHGFDAPYRFGRTGNSYINGVGDRYVLETLLSVGYALSPADAGPPPPGYRPWGRAGEQRIYRNTCFVPFGPVYHYWIDESRARAVPPDARELVALAAAVVPDGTGPPGVAELPQAELRRALEVARGGAPGERETLYREWARNLGGTTVEWEEFTPKAMSGRIDLERPGILYLSIPGARGWRALVNGEPAELLTVHFGLLGIALPGGSSRIELAYVPPLLEAGVALTGMSLLVVLFVGFRATRTGRFWRRRRGRPPV